MECKPEPTPSLHAFEDIVAALEQYEVAARPYKAQLHLRNMAAFPCNRVVASELVMPDDSRYPLANEERLAELQVAEQAAAAEFAQAVGLPETRLVPCFRQVVEDVQSRRVWQAKGLELRFNLSRGGGEHFSVSDFFQSVLTLARVTGERYSVWGNAYETLDAQIGPETDMEALLQAGLAADTEILERIKRYSRANAFINTLTDLDRLHRAYGIET